MRGWPLGVLLASAAAALPGNVASDACKFWSVVDVKPVVVRSVSAAGVRSSSAFQDASLESCTEGVLRPIDGTREVFMPEPDLVFRGTFRSDSDYRCFLRWIDSHAVLACETTDPLSGFGLLALSFAEWQSCGSKYCIRLGGIRMEKAILLEAVERRCSWRWSSCWTESEGFIIICPTDAGGS